MRVFIFAALFFLGIVSCGHDDDGQEEVCVCECQEDCDECPEGCECDCCEDENQNDPDNDNGDGGCDDGACPPPPKTGVDCR